MRSRIKHVLLRARYAALGAGIGAAIGSVFSRDAASTGGAVGAMLGATIADTRGTATTVLEEVKETEFNPLPDRTDSDEN